MNYSIVRYFVGWVLLAVGAFMLIPTALALISGDGVGTAFALSASLALAAGLVSCCVKPHDRSMYSKEGFAAVSLGWIAMSLVGALPLWISGFTPSFTDALFEVISGFTTTGASILTDLEALPPSLLLWRSLTHWIGGMGVLVFLLAILPAAGGDNLMLMKAESPGPSVGKLVPRLRKTAVYLYGIYLVLTVLEIILLLLGNMSLLDALCIGLATAGTGGFGVQSDSLASSSTYIQVVVTAFMFIFGVNFNFYFYLLIRRAKAAFGMEEVRWYLVIFAAAVLLVTGCLYADGVYGSVLLCLKYAAFQCASVMTTTGFASADFNLWPMFSKAVLLLLMFVGGCAGSTAGGVKVSRIIMYVKSLRRELSQMLHPRRVKLVTMDGKAMEPAVMNTAFSFLVAYCLLFGLSLLAVAVDGRGFTTSFTAVLACLNNVGPGLGEVGPMGSFAMLSPFTKYVLMFDMLAGRLELFPMLLLFAPGTWKR